MELESITLREVSQVQKDKDHVFPLTCGNRTLKINVYIKTYTITYTHIPVHVFIHSTHSHKTWNMVVIVTLWRVSGALHLCMKMT
jgi:hypothetical protein